MLTHVEVERLRKQARMRHEARVATSEADLRADLDAIQRVARLLDAPVDSSEAPRGESTAGNGLIGAVRAVVRDQGDATFTIRDLLRPLKAGHGIDATEKSKRASISGALRRLAEKGEIAVVRSGRGKQPSLYERKEGSGHVAQHDVFGEEGEAPLDPELPPVERGGETQKYNADGIGC